MPINYGYNYRMIEKKLLVLVTFLLIYFRINEGSDYNTQGSQLLYAESAQGAYDCSKVQFEGGSSFVCKCNSTFCDQVEPIGKPNPKQIIVYMTTENLRLKRTVVPIEKTNTCFSPDAIELTIHSQNGRSSMQKIFGFGGAFTDAVGYNLAKLSKATSRHVLEAYFGGKGIDYTLGRVPIASCDFSTHEYSYLDKANDFEAESFALATEDLEYKIPLILAAQKLSGGRLKLFASPWSAPGWMKTNNRMKGGAPLRGRLNGAYYRTYAKYFVRFFEEYAKKGVMFWALTIQNEPKTGENPNYTFQTMNMDPNVQREFAKHLLAPLLRDSLASSNVKIMAHDDQRDLILNASQEIYSDNDTVINGLGVHWYSHTSYDVLSEVQRLFPSKFILPTEACTGEKVGPILGDWDRGMQYAKDIMYNLLNWAVGWTDWNLALDMIGGPNWVNNFVDAPIIVNAELNEFYKQPMYYFLGHFSKFIPRGSVRVDVSTVVGVSNVSVEKVGFRTPSGDLVVVILSLETEKTRRIILRDARKPHRFAQFDLPPMSIFTALMNT